jgi:hypothetical protein
MWFLQRMSNVVKKFYWNHTHNHRVSIQSVLELSLNSAWIKPVLLNRMMILRAGQTPDNTGSKITVDTAFLSL